MEPFVFALGLTLCAGMATALGAAMAFFTKRDSSQLLSIGLGFSAGVMIYVSFGEILVKARQGLGEATHNIILSEVITLLAFLGGFLVCYVIDRSVPDDINPHELKSSQTLLRLDQEQERTLLRRTALFTALAIAIHNFPEGFATFIAGLDGMSFGIPIAIAVAIHNIPEGMAISLPLYYATGDRQKAFWYAVASGMAEPLGAVIGYVILFPFMTPMTMGIVYGFVAGIMIYICFDELLPSARIYGDSHTAMIGLGSGMGVMGASLIMLKAWV